MRKVSIPQAFYAVGLTSFMLICSVTIRNLPSRSSIAEESEQQYESEQQHEPYEYGGNTNNEMNIYNSHEDNLVLKSRAQKSSTEELVITYGNLSNAIDEKEITVFKLYDDPVVAVVVLVCDRVIVRRCLQKLLEYRPSAERFPIIVSQDCQHELTANVIRSFGDQVVFIRQPEQETDYDGIKKMLGGYDKIARHYVKALNQTFIGFGFNYTIVVEDDLEVACDFFEYFSGTLPILQADPTLFCVSAWNDNGKPGLVQTNAPELLHRTDFFPGLGWMLAKSVWLELAPKWPTSYWDDWIRSPKQMKNRACIRPEISRTKHFGMHGVSSSIFHKKHLKSRLLNQRFVEFTKLDLTYLLKSNYDDIFMDTIFRSPNMTLKELEDKKNIYGTRAVYCDRKEFGIFARRCGLMGDIRSGVPRTAYKGIVNFFYKNARVYLIILNNQTSDKNKDSRHL